MCPVEGCQGQAENQTGIRVHFVHRHVRETMFIVEEGSLPHPLFTQCNFLAQWEALNS